MTLGDSGGPAYASRAAPGILSGSVPNLPCELLIMPIRDAEAALKVDVVTYLTPHNVLRAPPAGPPPASSRRETARRRPPNRRSACAGRPRNGSCVRMTIVLRIPAPAAERWHVRVTRERSLCVGLTGLSPLSAPAYDAVATEAVGRSPWPSRRRRRIRR